MSEFAVNTEILGNQTNGLDAVAKQLEYMQERVGNIKRDLRTYSCAHYIISQNLYSIKRNIREESMSCRRMSNGLNDAIKKYRIAEMKICLPDLGFTEISKLFGTGAEVSDEKTGMDFDLLKFGHKIAMGLLGPIGNVVQVAIDIGDHKYGKGFKNLLKLTGSVVKNKEGAKINWKEFLKISPSDKTAWAQGVGKYFDFSAMKKGVSSLCNWGAELVESAWSNYEEFHNLGTRFWEETVTETLLGVGEGILATAGSAFVCGLLFANPTGLVIAGGAAAITFVADWGLDSIAKKVSGNPDAKWKEAVSDFYCDAFEVYNGVKNFVVDTLCPWKKLIFA